MYPKRMRIYMGCVGLASALVLWQSRAVLWHLDLTIVIFAAAPLANET